MCCVFRKTGIVLSVSFLANSEKSTLHDNHCFVLFEAFPSTLPGSKSGSGPAAPHLKLRRDSATRPLPLSYTTIASKGAMNDCDISLAGALHHASRIAGVFTSNPVDIAVTVTSNVRGIPSFVQKSDIIGGIAERAVVTTSV